MFQPDTSLHFLTQTHGRSRSPRHTEKYLHQFQDFFLFFIVISCLNSFETQFKTIHM